MSYLVLARKWRPQRFEDVVGQGHVTRTLANAIRMDRVAHAFLFSGVRGVGKTSLARILAKALNCEQGPTVDPCGNCASCRAVTAGTAVDVIEIDGASNNSVDDIRGLRETVPYRPSLGRFKLYIIDEVHMLSVSAFNALLKTLEEPPAHVKFIFATTEPHKIPSTILSRCQRYDFRRIPTTAILGRIRAILASEDISAEEGALAIIGREAEGSMRDALSVLDQVLAAATNGLTADGVADLLGVVSRRVYYDLSAALLAGDARRCLGIVADVDRQGFDVPTFSRGLLEHLRNLVVAVVCRGDRALLDLPDDEAEELSRQASTTTGATVHRLFKHFSEAYEELARSSHPRVLLEAGLARLAEMGQLLPAAELVGRLEALTAGRTSSGGSSGGQSSARGEAGPSPPGSGVGNGNPVRATPATPPAAPVCLDHALEAFARENPAMASVIERALPELADDGVLRLRFDKSDGFAASVAMDAGRQRQIVDFLAGLLGRQLRLEVELADLGGMSTAARTRLERQNAERTAEDEARRHPLVQGAVTELTGRIAAVRLASNRERN
ncbi:MAG TPA: DNA polymerase III subunit gamma/tau [Polyangia bacterium]|nr:DNA polymerase III subunit gamma/tau [Polyangia bacterium]